MAHTVNNINFPLLDKLNIPYIVKISKGNRLTIKINQENQLIILIPPKTKLSKVDEFLSAHLDWINKNRQKNSIITHRFVDGETYLYLGKEYKIKIVISKYPTVVFSEDNLYIYTRNSDFLTISKIVDDWKYHTANLLFNELLFKTFQKMKKVLNKYPDLIIKKYKSRWGTCYFKRNQIILNIALIHTNIQCIEYVICHELAHFIYPDHSKEFHALVNQFVNESACLKLLKRYRATYE